jgi:hypothetical protein
MIILLSILFAAPVVVLVVILSAAHDVEIGNY